MQSNMPDENKRYRSGALAADFPKAEETAVIFDFYTGEVIELICGKANS